MGILLDMEVRQDKLEQKRAHGNILPIHTLVSTKEECGSSSARPRHNHRIWQAVTHPYVSDHCTNVQNTDCAVVGKHSITSFDMNDETAASRKKWLLSQLILISNSMQKQYR